jgi:hypothetical protein
MHPLPGKSSHSQRHSGDEATRDGIGVISDASGSVRACTMRLVLFRPYRTEYRYTIFPPACFDISPNIVTDTTTQQLQSPKSLNVDMNNTSEMQAATEDTTSADHDREKDAASSKPKSESIDDVLETPQVDLEVPTNPPTAPRSRIPATLWPRSSMLLSSSAYS